MAETHSHYMSTILAFYEISYEKKEKRKERVTPRICTVELKGGE